MYLHVQDYGYFRMEYPALRNDGTKQTKEVTAYSIEKEVFNVDWVGLKINTAEEDSQEMLIDGNVTGYALPEKLITFHNPYDERFSLLSILISKTPLWSVGYIDPNIYRIKDENGDFVQQTKKSETGEDIPQYHTFTGRRWIYTDDGKFVQQQEATWTEPKYKLKSVGIYNEDNISIYAFLTSTLGPKLSAIFFFDTEHRVIHAISKFSLQTEDDKYDTGIYVGFRNLANNVDLTVEEDSVVTRVNCQGDNLNFLDLNYGSTRLINLSYFAHEPYMTDETAAKVLAWQQLIQDKRQAYKELAAEAIKISFQISDITYKVPADANYWKNWQGMNQQGLKKSKSYYLNQLAILQESVDDTPRYDSEGKYIPYNQSKTDDWYETRLANSQNGYGGYGTYYEIVTYILPNINVALNNLNKVTTDPTYQEYVKLDYDWELYGIVELEAKIKSLQTQLQSLKGYYGSEWPDIQTQAAAAIMASHAWNKEFYNKQREEYLKLDAAVGTGQGGHPPTAYTYLDELYTLRDGTDHQGIPVSDEAVQNSMNGRLSEIRSQMQPYALIYNLQKFPGDQECASVLEDWLQEQDDHRERIAALSGVVAGIKSQIKSKMYGVPESGNEFQISDYGSVDLAKQIAKWTKELADMQEAYGTYWPNPMGSMQQQADYREILAARGWTPSEYYEKSTRYSHLVTLVGDDNVANTTLSSLYDDIEDLNEQLQQAMQDLKEQQNADYSWQTYIDGLGFEPYFNNEDLSQIYPLLIDTDYSNTNIAMQETDTALSRIDVEQELLDDCLDKVSELSQPQITFSSDLDNLYRIEVFKDLRKDLKLLNYIHLGIRDDYTVKLRVVGISWNPCDIDSTLTLEFSNMITSRSGRSDFTDIISAENNRGSKNGISIGANGQIGGSGQSMDYLTNLMQALSGTGIFKKVVRNTVTNPTTGVSNLVTDQEFTYAMKTVPGISRFVLDAARIADMQEGDTIISGGKVKTGFINARYIAVEQITSATYSPPVQGSVYSEVGMSINLNAKDSQNRGGKGTITAPNFAIDADGNAYFRGTVTGSTIIASTIQNAVNNPTFSVSSAGVITSRGVGENDQVYQTLISGGHITTNDISVSGGSLDIGNGTFLVDYEGNLIATSASINGSIEASNDVNTVIIDPDDSSIFRINRKGAVYHIYGIYSQLANKYVVVNALPGSGQNGSIYILEENGVIKGYIYNGSWEQVSLIKYFGNRQLVLLRGQGTYVHGSSDQEKQSFLQNDTNPNHSYIDVRLMRRYSVALDDDNIRILVDEGDLVQYPDQNKIYLLGNTNGWACPFTVSVDVDVVKIDQIGGIDISGNISATTLNCGDLLYFDGSDLVMGNRGGISINISDRGFRFNDGDKRAVYLGNVAGIYGNAASGDGYNYGFSTEYGGLGMIYSPAGSLGPLVIKSASHVALNAIAPAGGDANVTLTASYESGAASTWKTANLTIRQDSISMTTSSGYNIGIGGSSQISMTGDTHITGSVYITKTSYINGSVILTSDRKVKKDFNSLTPYEKFFMDLEPITFKWNGAKDQFDSKNHFGLVAQQVVSAFNNNNIDYAKYGLVDEKENRMALAYTEFIPLCIHMIQKQQKEINELKDKIEVLTGGEKN